MDLSYCVTEDGSFLLINVLDSEGRVISTIMFDVDLNAY
jgi:hypothetical protein